MSSMLYLRFNLLYKHFSPCEIFKVQWIVLILLSSYPSGDKEIRTLDPLLARQVLSQLSYTPRFQGVFSPSKILFHKDLQN